MSAVSLLSQSNVPRPRTWLSTPNCGLNMSFHTTAAMTGAIISGRMSTRSKILPMTLLRLSRSAMPTPSTVSMTVAAMAKTAVTRTEAQNCGSLSTLVKLLSPTKCGSGLLAV